MNNRATFIAAGPRANAEDATRAAYQARAEIEALRALTPAEAVERIKQTRAAEQAAREAADHVLRERQQQLDVFRAPTRDSGPNHGGSSLSR